MRGDELFELADSVLCAPGALRAVELTLLPEHRRGHGAMYDGLNHGRIHTNRLRQALAGLRLPRFPDGRLVLAVDVSPWLRSDAPCSPDRLFCHVCGRAKTASQFIVPSCSFPPSSEMVVPGAGAGAGAGSGMLWCARWGRFHRGQTT